MTLPEITSIRERDLPDFHDDETAIAVFGAAAANLPRLALGQWAAMSDWDRECWRNVARAGAFTASAAELTDFKRFRDGLDAAAPPGPKRARVSELFNAVQPELYAKGRKRAPWRLDWTSAVSGLVLGGNGMLFLIGCWSWLHR